MDVRAILSLGRSEEGGKDEGFAIAVQQLVWCRVFHECSDCSSDVVEKGAALVDADFFVPRAHDLTDGVPTLAGVNDLERPARQMVVCLMR